MSGPIVGGYLAGMKLPLAGNFIAFSCAAVLAAVFVILIPRRYAADPRERAAAGAKQALQRP
jgi:AAHS family benzoate transporter-like MFS transporter